MSTYRRSAALIILLLLCGCAAGKSVVQAPPPPSPVRDTVVLLPGPAGQPDVVVVTTGDAAAPAGQPSTPVEGSAVVPPSAAGGTSTTAVTVTTSSGSVTLDQPYATADVTAAGVISTRKMEETEVNTRFGEALSAKPPRPISYVLYFLEGSDRLTPDSEASLDQVKADLAKWPAPQVSVIGHTDTVGNPAINDKLALQRAELVKRTLVGIGIAPEGIEVVSRGERELLVQTGDEVPEPRNRRVEINIR